MQTELKIVYTIIDTVFKQSNDDNKISERFVRSLIHEYRSVILQKYYEKEQGIPDECFQMAYNIVFKSSISREFFYLLPKIIRLKNNAGIYFQKSGYPIPIVSASEYYLSKNHTINKNKPKIYTIGNKATLFIGNKNVNCRPTPGLNEIIDLFEMDMSNSNSRNVTLDVFAVFDNPDDVNTAAGFESYNWTTDPFPMPSEGIKEIIQNILRDKFGIILQIKEDKSTNLDDEE